MLRLSRKLMFAIEAVVDIASQRCGQPGAKQGYRDAPKYPAAVPGAGASAVCPRRRAERCPRTAGRVPVGTGSGAGSLWAKLPASWRPWRIRAILLKVRRARCSVAKCCGPSGTSFKTMRSPNSIKSASKTFAVEPAIPALKGRANR